MLLQRELQQRRSRKFSVSHWHRSRADRSNCEYPETSLLKQIIVLPKAEMLERFWVSCREKGNRENVRHGSASVEPATNT
jgi:hypothetical protein